MVKKKDKKGKLPKRIAGVKLPKEARKQAERAIAELKQPIVREMIAGAVGMAATALAKQAAEWKAPRSAPPPEAKSELKTEHSPESLKSEGGKSSSEQFAEIATGLAVAGLGKLFEKMQAAGDGKAPSPPKA